MLDITLIRKMFQALNEELAKTKIIGEIGICGGAVMCLVFQARMATKDIDGIFEPAKAIRQAAKKVAHRFGLDESWLNDAAKAYFHVDPPKEEVMQLSNLRVWAPRADYMLAMKCAAARLDTHDKEDIQFLVRYLKLVSKEEVFRLIEKYYPKSQIPAKTQFLIEEWLQ